MIVDLDGTVASNEWRAFAIDDREQVIGMWRDEELYVLEAVDPGHPPLSRR